MKARTGRALWRTLLVIALLPLAHRLPAQTIQEFIAPLSFPYDITVGSDGAIWFTSFLRTVFRLRLDGTFTEFPVPGFPLEITAGPDGALWITDATNGQIVRLTPTGAVMVFPLTGARPGDITSGPDGALWFSEFNPSRIGRMTVTGALSEFPVPSGTEPGAIVAGPDGAIWFSGRTPPTLGRLALSGQFTEFAIPTRAVGMTVGPDGAFWMTTERNSIGRMTLTGQFSEFPIPTGNSVPLGITSGPDGALWFTEGFVGKIGRVTAQGVFSEFIIPTAAAQPYGITTGPDGNIWFAELFANRIGRLLLAPAITSPAQLPQGFVGLLYTVSLTATSGLGPYTWSVVSGELPPGLVLSITGVLSGTPLRAGQFAFTVEVRDTAGGVGRAAFSLGILDPQSIPTLSGWAIFLLASLLAGAGLVALRR